MTFRGRAEPCGTSRAYLWKRGGTSGGAGMSRTVWTWARLLGGAAILAVLIWRLGTGPFLDGVRTIDARSLAAAAGIARGDDGLQRVAMATGRPGSRCRRPDGHGGRRLLPVPDSSTRRFRVASSVTCTAGCSHGRDVGDVGRGPAGRRLGTLRRAGRADRAGGDAAAGACRRRCGRPCRRLRQWWSRSSCWASSC